MRKTAKALLYFPFLCGAMTVNAQSNVTLAKSTTTELKATVVNTNFVIPIIRFNTLDNAGQNNQKGNVSFFNSVGAGLSINRGTLEVTTNDKGEIINREMNNIIGAQLGLLFAANTGAQNNINIFAPTLSISVLNLQLGVGYELGSLPTNDNRTFFTIAYGIPLAKLVKGGFYVLDNKDKQGQKQEQVQGFQ